MRVLMPVLHYYPVIGGLEMWTQNIAERLSDRAEIFVVTGRVENQPLKERKNGVNIFRTSLFSLKYLSPSNLPYILTALPFIFFKSFYLIKKEKINLLHCQGFLGSFLGYLLSKFFKIPYITTVQRLEKRGFLRELVYKNAKVCIGASSPIKDYFEKIGVKNIEVIPNGIDLKKFENLERKQHQGFVVITVARLEKVKGIEFLIKAFVDFRSQQSQQVELWIIGDGSERKNLEELTKKLDLEEKIKFLGAIPNEKIPEYLAQADCFVLPSLKEGFGIVILEARAADLPVIGTRVGGIKELIEDGKTGILVEPGNSEAIAKAIQKIYSNPELRTKLINLAMARLKRYDWQNIAERVYSIYQKILK